MPALVVLVHQQAGCCALAALSCTSVRLCRAAPMQVLFAFAMGFILKAVGPALVMQLMFELQSKRLGTDRSESMLAVS